MSVRALSAAVVLLATLAAAGCGQTGALRLPEQAPERESYLIGRNPNAKPRAKAAGDALPAAEAPVDEPAPAVPAPAPAP